MPAMIIESLTGFLWGGDTTEDADGPLGEAGWGWSASAGAAVADVCGTCQRGLGVREPTFPVDSVMERYPTSSARRVG